MAIAERDRSGLHVLTPVFEGPFDLLLHLILREQVDLYEVHLASIVDAYLTELERLQALDLEVTTEFLLIAATLVELKARRLLPEPDSVDLDDELGLWEERDLLLARLLECKTFKDVAGVLARREAHAARSFPRVVGLDERFTALQPDLLEGVTAEHLRDALQRALAPKPVPRVELHHVSPVRLTVAEVVDELAVSLPELGRTTFRRLTASCAETVEVIVHFLAVLELYKLGLIDLDQPTTFGELTVSWQGGSHTPATVDPDRIDVYDG